MLPVSQNTRINDHNQIGWFATFLNYKIGGKWSLHGEYQWRRDDYVTHWQQSLLRTGIGYQANPKAQFRLGYAWIETYPYGEYPLNGFGKQFTEHRLYEMAILTDKIGRFDLSHRFMLEQRWVGRYTDASLEKEDEFPLLNRLRYMSRIQMPLKGAKLDDREPYVAVYDEIMLGFGKNVNENVYDQNRFGLLLGYRFGPRVRIEGGFFSQILQLGREIRLSSDPNNPRNVFQHNNGFIVNAVFSGG
jgi:Protein of unknown function (DUF2490).